jgi:hypothetical protein
MSSKSQFNTLKYYFKWSHLNSNRFTVYEQASHIRGPQNLFTVSPPSSKDLLAILKNTLELERWTNRNQEFTQKTNRKQRGPQRNSVDISPINVGSQICFHLNRVGNGNDDISSE